VDKLSPTVVDALPFPAASQQIANFPVDYAVTMVNEKEIPAAFKKIMVNYIQDFANLPVSEGITTIGQGLGYIISDFIISTLSFVILAVVFSAIFRIFLPRLFNSVAPKRVTTLDKAGGAILGLASGLVSVAVLIILLTPLASLGALKGNPSPLAELVHASFMVEVVTIRLESVFEIIFASKGL